jgi:hypothetical protein
MAANMLTKEQVEELRAKHGRIAHVKGTEGWEIVLRKPTRGEMRKLRSDLHNPTLVASAIESFVCATSVHPPEGPELDKLLDEWPGIPDACQGAVQKLSGMAVDEAGK